MRPDENKILRELVPPGMKNMSAAMYRVLLGAIVVAIDMTHCQQDGHPAHADVVALIRKTFAAVLST